MKAWPLEYDSLNMLAISAYVKIQSRGKKVDVRVTTPLKPFFEKGREHYQRRRGQYNLSCGDCHNRNFGKKFQSQLLSQGHSNGFPEHLLNLNMTKSLHWRFQACNRLVRAEPYPLGSEEYVNLELYLAWRGNGLPVETPAVRD